MGCSSNLPCVISTFRMRLLFLPPPPLPLQKSTQQRRSTVLVPALMLAMGSPKLALASMPKARDPTSITKSKIQSSPHYPTSSLPSTRWTPGSTTWRVRLPAHPKTHLLSPDHCSNHRRPQHPARPPSSSRHTDPWELQSQPLRLEFLSFRQLRPSLHNW